MKALNYGSLNIDFVYNVEHFVRSGETISSQSMAIFAGGKGLSPKEAMQIAAKASAIAVSRQGAAPSIPELNEVYDFGR